MNSILENLIESNEAGGALYYPATGQFFISSRLQSWFDLGRSKNSLDELVAVMGEAILNPSKASQTRFPFLFQHNHYECEVKIISHPPEPDIIVLWCYERTEILKIRERANAETSQLKREVKQFSTILNMLPTPIWLRNQELAIKYCNMAYSLAAEEGSQHTAEETLELHPLARNLAEKAFNSGETLSKQRHIVIEGERKLYQFTEIPIQSDGITVGIAQDITELEKVKKELERYVSVQSELLESVNSAIAIFSADSRIRFFNNAYVRLWGLEENWLETNPTYGEILEILREKNRLPEQANFLQFKQQHLRMFTDLIESREEFFHLPDGKTLRILAIPHALGGILFAHEDVTNVLALERSYNTLIAVQKATLDHLHEGVVVFGENGRLKLYNTRFLHIWKLEKAVLSPETHISDLFEKTKALHFAEEWVSYKQKFIAELLVREVQKHSLERTDGTFIEYVVVPLPDGASLITFADVTASLVVERSLIERNDALSEADRLKTEFLANVSYELRSPLTSISGFSEMLAQNYAGKLSKKQEEYVQGIHQSAQHLMNLINDILDIASIEAGYMKLNVSEFDIYAMLQSVVSLINERIRENNLKFTLECSRKIGKMTADETRLKQIIFNLLGNSLKYSNPRGYIILKSMIAINPETSQEEVVFSVMDNGIGIALEEQKEIFDKFRKGSNSNSNQSGAGLGLSTVKSFVLLHGGRVELASVPQKGTTITCYLPRLSHS